jgi:hypothetical protein
MKLTAELIEAAVIEYLTEHTRPPKYILIDEASLEEFNKSLTKSPKTQNKSTESSWKGTHSLSATILPVKTEETLFEVVG